MILIRRAVALVFIGALITSTAACGRESPSSPADYAVYAEYSLTNKPMVAGWNTRVFNKREVEEGDHISLDEATGVVTLTEGTYHITAMSLVNYYDTENPTVIPNSLTPPAGYARLRHLEDAFAPVSEPTVEVINESNEKAVSVGTGSDANALPSFMETYLKVDDEAKIVVEHQVGDEIEGLYLQSNANGSIWHINARISIRRI